MAAETREETIKRLIMEQRARSESSMKQAPPPAPTRRTDYDESYDSHTFQPKRKTNDEILIHTLREENKKLRTEYGDLVQKANKLVAAYRELETKNQYLMNENQVLNQKKMKKEAVRKVFFELGKSVQHAWDKTIEWLKT
jgi:chromosome segregation ATPase